MEDKTAEPNLVQENLSEIFDELERKERFNQHINPVDWGLAKPVTEKHPYQPNFFRRIAYFFANTFIINKIRHQQMKLYDVQVEGKENLEGIDKAVVVANHYMIFDCLVYQMALDKKTKFIGAESNNRKGKLGFLMRAGGMIPMNLGQMPLETSGLTTHERRKRAVNVMRKLNKAIEKYLDKKHYIIVYPEVSMWLMYEKPRPFESGAFKWAEMYDVPVIPVFTTMDNPRSDKTKLTVHIGKPVYPKQDVERDENIDYLKNTSFEFFKNVYESVYNKKLEYLKDNK